jgi:PAS domain S-box-containing protein
MAKPNFRYIDHAAKLNKFFHISNELLCVANSEGYFVELNPAWMKLTGFTEGELKAQRFIEFVHPEDVEATIEEAKPSSVS